MYNIRIVSIFLAIISMPIAGQCQTEQPSALKKFTDSLVNPIIAAYHIPGLSIAVTVNGKHTFMNYGLASKEKSSLVDEKTLFELGSISKTFTAALASIAETEGKLNLSSPVSKYLPELKNKAFDQIRLYHLGTHTAGGFTLQLPDEIKNENELMAYYNSWKPKYPVGTQRIYTNPGIGLLGVVAGKVLKTSFPIAMKKHVLDEIGLTNTFYDVPEALQKDYAQGYDKTDRPVRVNPAVLADEAYGVKSSSADMIKFIDAQMGLLPIKKSILKALENTRKGYFQTEFMTQGLIWEQYDFPVSLNQLQSGNSYDMIYKPNKVNELIPHQEAKSQVLVNKTGSTNGFGGYVMFVPSKKIGIVVLANKNYPNADRIDIAYKILAYIQKEK